MFQGQRKTQTRIAQTRSQHRYKILSSSDQMKYFPRKMSEIFYHRKYLTMKAKLKFFAEKVIYFLLLDRKQRKPSHEDETEVSSDWLTSLILTSDWSIAGPCPSSVWII